MTFAADASRLAHAPAGWRDWAAVQIAEGTARFINSLALLRPCLAIGRMSGLGLAITPLLKGNADEGAEIYGGRYTLAGVSVVSSGEDVFDITGADPGWQAALHGFGWLAHLRASGRSLDRVHARAQIANHAARPHGAIARDPAVVARRVIHLIQHAPFFLPGASDRFLAEFRACLAADLSRLVRRGPTARLAEDRFAAALALLYAVHGLEGHGSLLSLAEARLKSEIARQILPDGGHVSRNPAVLLDLLSLILPLRQAVEADRRALPRALSAAVERMLPMLRFFTLGDGGLAAFHGAGEPMAGLISAVMAQDMVQGRPLIHAAHSGYARLDHGQASLIIDAGHAPSELANPSAARARAAFEFCDGPHRLIVNCGAPGFVGGPWAELARAEAASSAASLDSGESARGFSAARVKAEVRATREGSLVSVSHDGFVSRAGVMHERRIYLAPDGLDLRCEDCFPVASGAHASAGQELVLRFHLHPSVKATLARDGASVMLVTAGKTGWRFSARGAALALDDSVSLSNRLGPRRTLQIVIAGLTAGARVTWALKRCEEAPRGPKRTGAQAGFLL